MGDVFTENQTEIEGYVISCIINLQNFSFDFVYLKNPSVTW